MEEQHPPTPAPAPSPDATTLVSEERVRFKRRLKRVSIMVVLIVVAAHLLVGLGAGFLVVARYFAKPKVQFTAVKQVELKPEDRQHRLALDQLESMRPKPTLNNRIQSLKPTNLVLPELPKVPLDTAIPIDTSSIVVGQIEGLADAAQGSGSGSAAGGLFGGAGKAGSGLLEGHIYDLKQTKARTDSGMNPGLYEDAIKQFANKGESALKRYFVAPGRLYLTKLAISRIDANLAPAAFNAQDVMKPNMWVAVYKGRVIAPSTGKFRFQGYGDILLVWINGKLVYDGCGHPITALHNKPAPEFDAEQGKAYDMQIAMGSNPSRSPNRPSMFGVYLQIQKVDGTKPYWFRMTSAPTLKGEAKVGVDGPIWLPSPTTNTPGSITGVGL
ncbi:MAG: hypothetical protein PHC88_13740 [Terrimicrobiaceae bacterium]|nr:hypothetical protein [Terrimicrobiaceae bacterium]